MLIRSQNGLRITNNLDLSINKLYVDKEDFKRYDNICNETMGKYKIVYSIESQKISDLGDYSTEDNAKKVLNMIGKTYEHIATEHYVFMMPMDSEVNNQQHKQ